MKSGNLQKTINYSNFVSIFEETNEYVVTSEVELNLPQEVFLHLYGMKLNQKKKINIKLAFQVLAGIRQSRVATNKKTHEQSVRYLPS